MSLPAISMEAMLLGWARSHNGGSKITLQVNDDDLVHFEKMTVKKGRVAGQRLMAVFVEVGEDEKPVQQPATVAEAEAQAPKEKKLPLGGLAKWAVMRCQDPDFWIWMSEAFRDEWVIAAKGAIDPTDEALAKCVILSVCGIQSRRELDTDDRARRVFDEKFRVPYSKLSNVNN